MSDRAKRLPKHRPEMLIRMTRPGTAIRLRFTRDGVVLVRRVTLGPDREWHGVSGSLVLFQSGELRVLARAFAEIAEAEERALRGERP